MSKRIEVKGSQAAWELAIKSRMANGDSVEVGALRALWAAGLLPKQVENVIKAARQEADVIDVEDVDPFVDLDENEQRHYDKFAAEQSAHEAAKQNA